MKALIGIDVEGKYAGAMALLARLEFENAQWRLVHCRPSLNPNPISLHLECDEAANLLETDWADAQTALKAAKSLTPKLGGQATTCVVEAAPSEGLLRLAEETRADLIAIGSHEHGRIGSLILGSTSRALAIGSDRSFLVSRGQIAKDGPVRAVFATDHSSYANRCLDLFLEWAPRGLEQITFVTAKEMLELSDTVQYMTLMDEAAKEGLTFTEYTDRCGAALVAKAAAAGIKATYESRHGFVGQAIEAAITHHRAHLLILGAQGHGFIERLLIGSVALDLVVSAPCSTMILRVNNDQ